MKSTTDPGTQFTLEKRRRLFSGAIDGPLWVLLYLTLFATALLTVDDAHNWGGDFSLYIAHTRNLVEGTDYATTDWVYNPENPYMSPRSYPPGFPLILAPVYWLEGIDIRAFKVVTSIFLLASLPLIVFLFRRTHGHVVAMGAAILFGLNPYVWGFQKHVLSEFPFVFLSLVALLVIERRAGRAGWPAIGLNILAGVLIYALYATRLPGLVLLIAVVAYDAIRGPRALYRTAFLVGSFLFFWVNPPVDFGNLSAYEAGTGLPSPEALPGEPELESGPAFCVRCIGDRALDYVDEIEREFFPAQALEWRLTLVALLLAIAGGVISRHFLASREGPSSAVRGLPSTIARFLRSFSVGEIYAAGIVGLAVLLPYYALRYLIPAMPFLFAYALSGALWFGWFGRKWTHGKPVGALLLILGLLGAYGLKHRIFAYNMVTYAPLVGIEARESQDIFAYVRNRIPEGALVAFEKPRVLALFTGKRSTIWDPVPEGPPDLAATILLNDFLEREVGYLLVSSGGGVPTRPRWFQEGPVQDAFELQHATRHFQVWRFDQESARRVLQAISEGVPASPTPGSAPL